MCFSYKWCPCFGFNVLDSRWLCALCVSAYLLIITVRERLYALLCIGAVTSGIIFPLGISILIYYICTQRQKGTELVNSQQKYNFIQLSCSSTEATCLAPLLNIVCYISLSLLSLLPLPLGIREHILCFCILCSSQWLSLTWPTINTIILVDRIAAVCLYYIACYCCRG